eukprot:jgi/Bigna1/141966/aug1.66_g16674
MSQSTFWVPEFSAMSHGIDVTFSTPVRAYGNFTVYQAQGAGSIEAIEVVDFYTNRTVDAYYKNPTVASADCCGPFTINLTMSITTNWIRIWMLRAAAVNPGIDAVKLTTCIVLERARRRFSFVAHERKLFADWMCKLLRCRRLQALSQLVPSVVSPGADTYLEAQFLAFDGEILGSQAFRELSWRVTETATGQPVAGKNAGGALYLIGKGTVYPAVSYHVNFTATHIASGARLYEQATFSTSVAQVVAAIAGVSANLEVSASQPLLLDASTSYDPDQVANAAQSYSWSCVNPPSGASCSWLVSLTTTNALLYVPKDTLSPALHHVVTLEYVVVLPNGYSRNASTSVTLTVTAARIPTVLIQVKTTDTIQSWQWADS